MASAGDCLHGCRRGHGASALTQFLSARHEGKHRAEHYKREDIQRNRDDLKLTYSGLLRHLDECLLATYRQKVAESLIESPLAELSTDTHGRQKLIAKQEDLTEKMVGSVAAINSLLGVVDLLGETAVLDASYAYLVFIREMEPDSSDGLAEGQQLNAAMKDAMRKSLTRSELGPAN